jgi:hypothetical protein
MDNAQPDPNPARPLTSEAEIESHFETSSLSRSPVTPTKRPYRYDDRTPRPSGATTDHTPRPPISSLIFSSMSRGNQITTHHELHQDDPALNMPGFTLSYLRRVPELAYMARMVVLAEAKRRGQMERKRANEDSQKRTEHSNRVELLSQDKIGPKMKRLFKWAVVKLYEEGSIVLCDGPARVYAEGVFSGTSRLWKTSSSAFPSASYVEGEEDDLSDPQPHDEAYVPVTATFLAGHVEKAIATLMARPSKSRDGRGSVLSGPTQEDITTFMRRSDERWAHLGGWAVGDALEMLKTEGRAWEVGGGSWELCL